MKFISVILLALLAWTPTARAVVVLSGAANTAAPGGQPYFNNVGIVNGASGVYLGNRWMLTAAHVAPELPSGTIALAGSNYTAEPGSYRQLHNPGGYTELTDLALFRLASNPGLPTVSIATGSPALGADVMMIGRGRDQAASVTYWDVTVNPDVNDDVWTPVAPGGHDREGFHTLDSRTIRWGENDVAANGQVSTYLIASGLADVLSFTTSFDLGAKTHEAQGINGDSGGAVFVDNDGTWTLSGVMLTIETFEKQPALTAVVGNETAMADLSFYRNEILSLIPEPGTMILYIVGGGLLLASRRRG